MSPYIRRHAGLRSVVVIIAALSIASVLRIAWLTADPPTHATVGIVWHDEGAWVHNARNRALWGAWQTDEWNPIFLTPVFTVLEYAAFEGFGVGTWQARVVPVASGLASVALLAFGLAALAGARAACIGALLLATNYVFVMWNRAALMESTMTAFIVAGWAGYAAAQRWPRAGGLAGFAVTAAWFTKASAAFFLAAIVADCALTLLLNRSKSLRQALRIEQPAANAVKAATWTLFGLLASGAVALVLFVGPYWDEYRFYNWQMSVVRKPAYTLGALLDRASWLPVVHDFFTRMWLVLGVASVAVIAIAARWRQARPAERLLLWWLLFGLAELVVHDSGNERRYVMFVPALVALAALVLGRTGRIVSDWRPEPYVRWLLLPVFLLLAYLFAGSLFRLFFLYEVGPGVRLSAAAAALLVFLLAVRWKVVAGWLARQEISPAGAALVVVLAMTSDLAQYVQWAASRTYKNYHASVQLGRVLPPGTLVHGKLANGLALENEIRPIFVGREFGNYADRRSRGDVRYILTYIAPRVGYEGSVIHDVLDAYPNRTIIMTFDVAETASGRDRAALIDKFGGAPSTNGQTTGRAKD